MAEFNEIYRHAYYYDIVFQRSVDREVDFLQQVFLLKTGRPLQSAVEIACGPGYHATALARHGITTFGFDLRPEMVAFAQDRARAANVSVGWQVADMRAFALPMPVDLALTAFDSLDCLLTADELIDHLHAVARNLTPGGLYLFEMTHPRDCSMWNYGSFSYEGERDDVRVLVEWAVNNPVADAFTQVADVETRLTVTQNGRRQIFLDRAKERFATAQEYVALVKLSAELEVAACFGDFDLNQPFDNSSGSRRMIFLLQKRGHQA